MNKKHLLIGVGVIFALVLGAMLLVGDAKSFRYSKNLNCEQFADARESEVCRSAEKWQEYTCCGHAIFSPGYRTTFVTAKHAWCELAITASDRPLLDRMKNDYSLDPRLSNIADFLVRTLNGIERPEQESGSIFSPGASGYILEGGCQS
ncbi:MAG TPA: hypothetical protein VLB83_00720 [Candidatus Paceibacterota bacterium]|nr:hypothetical protein [Candidatus Paceibacterota bacterium]